MTQMGSQEPGTPQSYRLQKPAVAAIKPSVAAQKRLQCLVTLGAWLGRLFLKLYVQQVIVVGKEHLQQGPAVVMMNHSNVLDPLILAFHLERPIHFMVTEPFMADRFTARVFAWLGQIPKRKLDFDTRSIRTMKQWCQLGGIVGVFPEGHFSWDGYPLPLQPGLEQLVSYLDVPVVTVRLINGDRFWPPWAKNRRKTTLRLEIDPPKYFKPGEHVEDYVSSHIAVNPETCPRWPAFGKNLTAGLSRLLRFCPACGADQVLIESGDALLCKHPSCLSHWNLTSDNQLHEQKQGTSLSTAQALAAVYSHVKQQWLGLEPYFYSLGTVDVLDCTHAQWTQLDCGFLELQQGFLRVGKWHLPVHEVLAQTLDWGELIVLRTRRQRIALRMPVDSRALWTFVINEANNASNG
ncbi:MAG: lysophospholipid acyltransferase family protein [Legionellales bacterium]